MRILSTRLDDLRKQRDEWDENQAKSAELYNRQKLNFDNALHGVYDSVKAPIEEALSKFNLLDFDVKVDTRHTNNLEIKIRCNETRVHDETSALSWDWSAYIVDGEVKYESGSWSGLQATTPDQLASLKQTVEALELLNSLDWSQILDKQVPEYDDYITERNPRYVNRPNFEDQIKEEEIKEIIGQNIAVRGKSPNYNMDGWFRIVRETPKKYQIQFVYDYLLKKDNIDPYADPEGLFALLDQSPVETFKKDKLLPGLYYPFDTVYE